VFLFRGQTQAKRSVVGAVGGAVGATHPAEPPPPPPPVVILAANY